MKIVDVNILLYVLNKDAPEHPTVLGWWQEQMRNGEALGFAWSVIVGFLRISTNRRAFPQPLSAREALDYVKDWLGLPTARIVQETEDHWQTLQDLVEATGTAGNLTNDAHLAALAITHRAIVASCDADFLRFRQARWENPLTGGKSS